ncbi:uncharacterized protein LOC111696618 [Eurytemora carolleeae]|uniref:uncharacterized protein LOC111696618 n=1 Tax=Eurytemora carolleeae TaxID=1294199 RepID=UPI000C76B279|nr:uncharacterized protein LOC111696618 [Eurytemora carolleeae]|eukprot:XP_023322040.1 uncharacterized protein LOC111696618 [Eurytemora affinis]
MSDSADHEHDALEKEIISFLEKASMMDSTNHIGSADSGVSVGERYIFEASDSNLNSEFIKSSEQLHSKANIGNERSIPIQIECNYDGNGAKYSADLECNSTKPNQISHLERLIRTHSIWFIADLSREEAVRILHAKEEGNFLIRQSSHANTLALSIKLGSVDGFQVNHFIILASESGIRLEDSSRLYDNILGLVHQHSIQRCELPVLLALPEILRETGSRQYLDSLALLGKAFWRYPMSNPGRRSQILPEAQNVQNNIHLNGNVQNIHASQTGYNSERSILESTTSLLMGQHKILNSDWSDESQSREESILVNEPDGIMQYKYCDYKIVENMPDNTNPSQESPWSNSLWIGSGSHIPTDPINTLEYPVNALINESDAGLNSRNPDHPINHIEDLTPLIRAPSCSLRAGIQATLLEEEEEKRKNSWIHSPFYNEENVGSSAQLHPESSRQGQHIHERAYPQRPEMRLGAHQQRPEMRLGAYLQRPEMRLGAYQQRPEMRFQADQQRPEMRLGAHQQRPEMRLGAYLQRPEMRLGADQQSPEMNPRLRADYFRSSITDKMSDYEDIWEGTPERETRSSTRFNRSLTPIQSEEYFKAYLLGKLQGKDPPLSSPRS